MFTMGFLVGNDLSLDFAAKGSLRSCADVKVTCLVSVGSAKEAASEMLPSGALVFLDEPKIWTSPPADEPDDSSSDLTRLVEHVASFGAAGVLTAIGPDMIVYPVAVTDLADRLGVPLLTTTQPVVWRALQAAMDQFRQLGGLLEHLSTATAGTEVTAIQSMAASLAETLDASVSVSDAERGILAVSPEPVDAPDAVIPQMTSVAGSATRTYSVSLAPDATTALAVTKDSAITESDTRLIECAAQLMGLIDQARRQRHAGEQAVLGARLAGWQLLMAGRIQMAQQVLSTVSSGVLDSALSARIHVIDCGRQDREVTASRCEDAVGDRALVIHSPEVSSHIIVVEPGTGRPGTVGDDLSRAFPALGDGILTSTGEAHPMDHLAEAYSEALAALRAPSRVLASGTWAPGQTPPLIGLISVAAAREWSLDLLQPLLALPGAQQQQLSAILRVAIAHPYTTAARRLSMHRNTVASHMGRVSQLLGMDLTRVADRVVVSFALDVLQLPAQPAVFWPASSFHALLDDAEPRAWAKSVLQGLGSDRRDLLRTGQVWLECETKVQRAARYLALSEATVRNHLTAISDLAHLDLTSLAGVRDLTLALHITTGRPLLQEPLANAA